MLTPVVSNKKVKNGNGRKAAKDLILRKELTVVGEPAKSDEASKAKTEQVEQVEQVEVKKAEVPSTGANEFTTEELSRLDMLFDILSWLAYLFAGNYEAMNNLGDTIGFGQIDLAKVDAVKSKLREQVNGLISKVENMIDTPEPIEASAVSDIQNEIKALV